MVERMEEQYKSFCNHFKNQTDMKIQKDYFWEVQTDDVLKGQGSAHKTVAISMMIMLQNSVCSDKDKVNLINQQIVFVKAVNVYENGFFPKLMDILEANKFRFRLTSENKSTTVVAESLLPKESFKNLPLVYQGKDEDGRIYIGEKWGNANIRASEGSTSHDILKKTALSEFPKENRTRLYQFQHPEIDKVKMVKRDSSKTPAQKIIFDKMKEEASKMESLGQMACLIGKMLGAQINGHPIKLLNQKFSHFDDGFKKKEFEDFFGYFFGCGVEVDIPVFVKDKSGKVVWNC
ncbi:uncharacterized protein LOC118434372 [Folsomia candida]|nr:uncharacterized protein LOC118434372 [Folsomia candida]